MSQQRRPGRPRIHAEERQRITIEMPVDVIQAIDAEAEATGQSRTAIIERLLIETVEAVHSNPVLVDTRAIRRMADPINAWMYCPKCFMLYDWDARRNAEGVPTLYVWCSGRGCEASITMKLPAVLKGEDIEKIAFGCMETLRHTTPEIRTWDERIAAMLQEGE